MLRTFLALTTIEVCLFLMIFPFLSFLIPVELFNWWKKIEENLKFLKKKFNEKINNNSN